VINAEAAQPVRVQLIDQGKALSLVWNDDARTQITAATLRAFCRCSGCSAAAFFGAAPAPAAGLAIAHAQLMGRYALNLQFSDGHDRGIYPWSYLRDIGAGAVPSPSQQVPA
jgi:DUF971 family protein